MCLSTASPNFQSGDFVFRTFINDSGWNNGVAWILGLLQSEYTPGAILLGVLLMVPRFIRSHWIRCRFAHGGGDAKPIHQRAKGHDCCSVHWCFQLVHLPHLSTVLDQGCRHGQLVFGWSPPRVNVPGHWLASRCSLSSGKLCDMLMIASGS